MNIADKLIALRKKSGMTQEELAEKMDVSRQAVSKWESGQTVPDLGKIIQLSELFGVTTDYLLKDESRGGEATETVAEEPSARKVSKEEAVAYLAQRKRASWQIALATLLCILSPICLIVLGAASDDPAFGISETVAGIVGLGVLFAFILCAVPIYIACGFGNEPYEFLEKNEPFALASAARELVSEQKEKFRPCYVRSNIIATCLCIASPVPLIVSAFLGNAMLCVLMVALLLAIVGVGVFTFIVVGVRQESLQNLLREGTEQEKRKSSLREAVDTAYWGIIVIAYLAWSFLTGDWHMTWILFVIGGVLSPLVMYLCDRMAGKRGKYGKIRKTEKRRCVCSGVLSSVKKVMFVHTL